MKVVKVETRVRYSECDPMGVVHNSNYFSWFEMGRFEIMRQVGVDFKKLNEEKIYFPVIKAECTYKQSALFDDEIVICTRLHKPTMAKLMFEYEIYRKQNYILLAIGKTSHAITTQEKGMILNLPTELKEKIYAFLDK
ncbi:acyl-CoA thioesterase [Clostridium felsineum]|uniref:Esterase n=1 Tax=Clostridium felsineum TaxID=36839 RepID=A0A1S8KY62_9CLOT|nr:thioesterase family protein [Clostridium felsineum]URZ05471.1 Putative esterase [Clostridium felsineum]URZ10511.1 Putative esterase [Clostridium felsineum]